MGKQTIFESIKEWFAGKCWKWFLKLNNLTEKEYFRQIKEQELRTDESRPVEKLVSQKTADEFRKLAEKTYVDLAGELIRLAGEDKVKARKTMEFMKARGFDNEDMQIIPILEKALWQAYDSRFSG